MQMRCLRTMTGIMLMSMALAGCSESWSTAPAMETTGPNQVVLQVPGMS